MDVDQKAPQANQTLQLPPTAKVNRIALVGFMLAFLVPIIGLVVSIIGLVKAKDYGGDGKRMSIAGIFLSSFLILASLIVILAYSFSSKDTLVFVSLAISGLMFIVGISVIVVAFKMSRKKKTTKSPDNDLTPTI